MLRRPLFVICSFIVSAFAIMAQEKPNIVLIVADDLGQRDLAVYGNSFIETPNLDRLANAGVLFTNGYASAPICSPTRASIMTGSAPARIGMTEHLRSTPPVSNSQLEIPPENVRRIPDTFPILGEVLKSEGYRTAHIGKAHFGGDPANYGYDLVFSGGSLPGTYYYPFFGGNPYPELTDYAKEGDYLTDVLTNRSIDFILEESQVGPFFLHLNYYAPHVPIEGRVDLVEKYEQKAALDPGHVFPEPEYAAMVEGIDENVGRIIEHLEALELLENTLVIFTSDNGALHVEEVPQFAQFTPPTDNYPLRAGKGYLYEGGTRVPFLFAGLDVIPGLEIHTPIISADIFSTLTALTGSAVTGHDGVNIYPLLNGGTIQDRFLYQHFPHYSPQRGRPMSSVIAGDLKLIKWAERDTLELFDLRTDTSESCNLVLQQTQLADSLDTLLEEWLDSVGARRTTPNPDYNDNPVRVREPFDYRTNSKLQSRNKGSGWAYNWVRTSGQDLFVREGTLDAGPMRSSGGYLALGHTGAERIAYRRVFMNPYIEFESLWCAFALRHSGTGSFKHVWNDPEGEPLFSVQRDEQGGAFILQNEQTAVSQAFEIPADVAHWVVVKIGSPEDTDSVSIWIDPPQDTLPAASQALAIVDGFDFSAGLGSIDIEVGDEFDGALDEWIMGFGYEDISPDYQPDFPPYDVHEPFTYEAGESPIGKGIDTLGWLGSWENAGNLQSNTVTIEPGNLRPDDETGDAPAHVRLAYTQSNTQIRLDRTLEQPIISDGSTYWLSYWAQTQPTNATGNVANVNLVNSNISAAEGHRLTIGRLYGTGRLGLITPSNGQRSNSNISDQGLRHIVVRIRTARSAVDTVHMWINPDRSAQPRLENANASLTTDVLKDGIDEVRLRVEGAAQNQTPLVVSFDHLRIGRTWEIVQLKDEEVTSNNALPISNDIASAILIFPNPANDAFIFKTPLAGKYRVTMFSASGQLVHAITVQATEAGQHMINVSHLQSGIYLVNIREQDKGLNINRRLLVQ